MSIPKIVHLTYISLDKIPDQWKNVIPAWKKTHPDWKLVFYSDQDNDTLVKTHIPWFYDTYCNFPYNIQRVDAVRCLYLYLYGGVYSDMDYMPIKNISPIFKNCNNSIYLTMSPNVMCFTNSFMASKKGEHFWIMYLKSMMRKPPSFAMGKHLTVMYTSGPLQLSNLVNSFHHIIGYIPSQIIHACNRCDHTDCKNHKYLKPLPGGTWNGYDARLYNFIMCNGSKVVCVIMIVLLFLIISSIFQK